MKCFIVAPLRSTPAAPKPGAAGNPGAALQPAAARIRSFKRLPTVTASHATLARLRGAFLCRACRRSHPRRWQTFVFADAFSRERARRGTKEAEHFRRRGLSLIETVLCLCLLLAVARPPFSIFMIAGFPVSASHHDFCAMRRCQI